MSLRRNEKNQMNAFSQGIPFSGAAQCWRGRMKISGLSQQSSQALCGGEAEAPQQLNHCGGEGTGWGGERTTTPLRFQGENGTVAHVLAMRNKK